MSDLNKFIDTTRQFTQAPSQDTVPTPDRSAQVNLGLEMARRAGQQQPQTPLPAMPPIVPVAN